MEKDVNGVITRYLYDQEDILALFTATGCWQQTVMHGPGIDQPLAMLRDTNQDCDPVTGVGGLREPVLGFAVDGLGSVVALRSETPGVQRTALVAERYTYDSFGTLTLTGPGPDGLMDTADDVTLPQSAYGNPYAFTGREFDPESGLYYSRARYYDPQTGRFLQADPVFHLNPYPYVDNNPINFTDPTGHNALVAGAGAAAAAIGGEVILVVGGIILLIYIGVQVRDAIVSHNESQKGQDCPLPIKVSPERRKHILEGHGPGSNVKGKTEFPSTLSGDEIINGTERIANDPASYPEGAVPTGPGRKEAHGDINGVPTTVIVEPAGEGVITAYPEGIPRNP